MPQLVRRVTTPIWVLLHLALRNQGPRESQGTCSSRCDQRTALTGLRTAKWFHRATLNVLVSILNNVRHPIDFTRPHSEEAGWHCATCDIQKSRQIVTSQTSTIPQDYYIIWHLPTTSHVIQRGCTPHAGSFTLFALEASIAGVNRLYPSPS